MRVAGRKPRVVKADPSEVIIMDEDPILGWRLKKNLSFETVRQDGKNVRFSTTSSGLRQCGEVGEGDVVAFFGGSFTNGDRLLDDANAYPCQLQRMKSNMIVKNYGVQAYGTYQSLLALEEFVEGGTRPAFILYGYVGFHHVRNIAFWAWHRGLTEASSKTVYMPYVSFDGDGNLLRHPPRAYPQLYFSSISALSASLENFYARMLTMRSEPMMREITQALIEKMRDVSDGIKARFAVVYLHAYYEDKSAMIESLIRNGIDVVNCDLPIWNKPDQFYKIIDDGHPNSLAHEYWTGCIARWLHSLEG